MTTGTQTLEPLAGPAVETTVEKLEDCHTIYVSAGVQVEGESSGAHSMLEADASPQEVASALLRCVIAAANLHGPETYAALQVRLLA